MLATYLFRNPAVWVVPLLIQILSYWKILGKMGKRRWCAIIPILGEMEMSTDLFYLMRSFWRPAMITIAMFLTSRYLGMDNMYSLVMALVALIVYGVFMIRLYCRLAKQFGKGKGFTFGLIMMPAYTRLRKEQLSGQTGIQTGQSQPSGQKTQAGARSHRLGGRTGRSRSRMLLHNDDGPSVQACSAVHAGR